MKLRISIVSAFVLFILSLNAYIFFKTESKIEEYEKIPPFRRVDYTFSNKISRNSNVYNLLDKNESTLWRKEQKSLHPNFDLEVELELTHIYKSGKFIPKQFTNLVIKSCSQINTKLSVQMVFREAINVDKELRLPGETEFRTWEINLQEASEFHFDLKDLNLKESSIYPDNIYIFTLFIKELPGEEKEKLCLKDIYMEKL